MKWRSLGFRLSCFFSALLLAGLVSLSAALWWAVEYNMIAAVDELLETRAASFRNFAESEFGNVFIESRTDSNKGEFRGRIERVDPRRSWVTLQGTRIRLTASTEFEGSLRPADLEAGQFGEVEVKRQNASSDWEAATVAVVKDLIKEMKETFGEYAATAPDGHLIQFRSKSAPLDRILPLHAESSAAKLPWLDAPGLFTLDSAGYRFLRRDISLPRGTYQIQMASPLAAISATRAGLLRWAWRIFPLLILISLAGGYVFSRAALRPLQDFAEVAKRITAHRLSDRLEAHRTGDVIERLALTFNGMLERLESSVQRLDRFTADASHELRGPVAVIRTTSELALRHERTGDDLRRDLGEINAEAVRLSGIIEDLLTLARADGTGGGIAPVSKVDVGLIAAEVAAQFRRQAGPRVTASTAGGPHIVQGHEGSLRRLVLILVDNALRHNPDDTKVTIQVTHEGDGRVALSVADNGRGIPEDDLPRVFDRFYRADPARSRSSGAGLGLALARRIVEDHGGKISASSAVGTGTVFRVLLNRPVEKGEPGAIAAEVSGQIVETKGFV